MSTDWKSEELAFDSPYGQETFLFSVEATPDLELNLPNK
jgi:hypothetical protein